MQARKPAGNAIATFAQWRQSHHGQASASDSWYSEGEFSGPDLALGGQRIGFSQKDDHFAMRLDGADAELQCFGLLTRLAQRHFSSI